MDILLLSEGMKRRVALALAFLGNPTIILLDEPLENLDDETKRTFLTIIQEELPNKTIVIATHEPNVFQQFTTINFKLEKGKKA